MKAPITTPTTTVLRNSGGYQAQPLAIVTLIALGLLIAVASSSTLHSAQVEAKGIYKRSFAGLGCLGIYDKAKFARLDRICEECYQLYREPDVHSACRQDCFSNEAFARCVDALLLTPESGQLKEMANELYGK